MDEERRRACLSRYLAQGRMYEARRLAELDGPSAAQQARASEPAVAAEEEVQEEAGHEREPAGAASGGLCRARALAV